MNEEDIALNEDLPEENTTNDMDNDELKKAIEEQLNKIRVQNMLLGAQTSAKVILDKITEFECQPGKMSYADYKRLVKDIKNFCTTGLSRKVNPDGTTEPIEETTQN